MKKLAKKKEKKYFVSLCLKVPANFEVEVSAKNEKEAFEKAYNMFDGYDEGCISDPIWEETDLDIGGDNVNSPGVYIEEIE
jgi:hypothetical protein